MKSIYCIGFDSPQDFLENATDTQILERLPISQKALNKRFKGKMKRYRASLLEEVRIGGLIFHNPIHGPYDSNDPF